MARTYRRDARGRFAGAGYQGQTSGRGSRLKSPGRSLPKGATIKAAAPAGTLGSKRRLRPPAAPTAPAAGNTIKRTSGRASRRQPLALRANAVRAYKPQTPDGKRAAANRQIDRFVGISRKEMQGISDKAAGIKKRSNALMNKMAQRQARAFAQRGAKGITGDIARSAIRHGGGSLNRAAQRVIQSRMQRAADAAARGSKPAAKARSIYANQLAFTGSGKPKAGKNNLRPGPRNTTGTPKRRRKRKK